jgi:hypothetical protein
VQEWIPPKHTHEVAIIRWFVPKVDTSIDLDHRIQFPFPDRYFSVAKMSRIRTPSLYSKALFHDESKQPRHPNSRQLQTNFGDLEKMQKYFSKKVSQHDYIKQDFYKIFCMELALHCTGMAVK